MRWAGREALSVLRQDAYFFAVNWALQAFATPGDLNRALLTLGLDLAVLTGAGLAIGWFSNSA